MAKKLALLPMVDWQKIFSAIIHPLIALFRRNLFSVETEQFSKERNRIMRSIQIEEHIGSDRITPEEFRRKLTLDMLRKRNWFRPRKGRPGEWECSQCEADLSFQTIIHPIQWSGAIDRPIPLKVVRSTPFCKCRGPAFVGLGAPIFIKEPDDATDDPIHLGLSLQQEAEHNALKLLEFDGA